MINRFIRPLMIDQRGELATCQVGGVGLRFNKVEDGRWWAVWMGVDAKQTFSKSVANQILLRLEAQELGIGIQEDMLFRCDDTANLVGAFLNWAEEYMQQPRPTTGQARILYKISDLNLIERELHRITMHNIHVHEAHDRMVNNMTAIESYKDATD